jgi:ankyrin repeat protein
MMNIHTRFSALHWACVHGAEKIVNMLLENGAHYFLPDVDGYFPIDYAGIFQNERVIKLII